MNGLRVKVIFDDYCAKKEENCYSMQSYLEGGTKKLEKAFGNKNVLRLLRPWWVVLETVRHFINCNLCLPEFDIKHMTYQGQPRLECKNCAPLFLVSQGIKSTCHSFWGYYWHWQSSYLTYKGNRVWERLFLNMHLKGVGDEVIDCLERELEMHSVGVVFRFYCQTF